MARKTPSVYLTSGKKHYCSLCKCDLVSREKEIVLRPTKGIESLRVKEQILFCPGCRRSYITQEMSRQLVNRYFGYYLDVSTYNLKPRKKNKINKALDLADKKEPVTDELSIYKKDLSVVAVIDTDNDNRFIIYKNKTSIESEKNTLLYTDELARELLAAALRTEKKKQYKYNNMQGRISKAETFHGIERNQILKRLVIRKGGGLNTLHKRGGDSFVDILLFSPFTQRYEILTTTYNKFDEEYFVDARQWRKFVSKFGNPGIQLAFTHYAERDVYSYELDLRESSILMDYGYSSTLSKAARQEILAEMVDLGIISVYRIIQYLKFFIDFNGAKWNMANSRRAWEEDWDFIEKYKVNPDRFLIPHS